MAWVVLCVRVLVHVPLCAIDARTGPTWVGAPPRCDLGEQEEAFVHAISEGGALQSALANVPLPSADPDLDGRRCVQW